MDVRPPLRPRNLLWIPLLWLGIGLFDATQTVFVMRSQGMHHAWLRLFFSLLLSWAPWALATPFVLHLTKQFPPNRLRPLYTWIIHPVACALINLAASAWGAGLDAAWNPYALPSPPRFLQLWHDRFLSNLLGAAFLYSFIIIIHYVISSRDRLAFQQAETARLNEQLSKAQLDALRHQIEPHFLFNALNAISSLVRERRNHEAATMIGRLGDLLRRVLDDSSTQQVTLAEELEFLEKYLDIQKVRFSDRLRVTVDVPQELRDARIPSLLLQPVVENALKHGTSKRVQGGVIAIAASRSNGHLNLSVYNDGPNLSAEWQNSSAGIGLRNLLGRLQTLYAHDFEFTLRDELPAGVRASISLPYQPSGQER
jgi:two-component system, LytTR family, sensor kinase